jgi:hypothetical protein
LKASLFTIIFLEEILKIGMLFGVQLLVYLSEDVLAFANELDASQSQGYCLP